MSVRKIVEIEWFDAQSTLESFTVEELKQLKPLKTLTVGYLLLEEKDRVVVGFCDFGNGLIKHHQCIPKGMIENIKVIRDGRL